MRRQLYLLALTAILVAFFLVWLPHPAAGLSYIGLEMGEQAKFLPQVRSGAVTPGRSLFYLPPVTSALLLILLTTFWPATRRTWAARAIAVLVSLLAFPALEALGDPDREEWLWRLLLIALVILTAALSPRLARTATARSLVAGRRRGPGRRHPAHLGFPGGASPLQRPVAPTAGHRTRRLAEPSRPLSGAGCGLELGCGPAGPHAAGIRCLGKKRDGAPRRLLYQTGGSGRVSRPCALQCNGQPARPSRYSALARQKSHLRTLLRRP
jgi:hypothetical protein